MKDIQTKTYNDKKIKIGLSLILFQAIATLCGVLTENIKFEVNNTDTLLHLIGYHIPLIIGIVLLIKNSNRLLLCLKQTFSKVMLLLIAIIYILVAIMCIKGITVIPNGTEDKHENTKLRASHILVDDYAAAQDIIEKLDNGYDFCMLVLTYSIDIGTVENCGDLGYFEEGEMVIEFEDAVKQLTYNEYSSKPVSSDYGYHVIMRTK